MSDVQGPYYPQQQPAWGTAPQPGFDPSAPYGRDPVTGQPLSDKSKVVAGVLQLFFGGLGVGRFYMGSTGIAVTQLLMTVFGFLLAIVLVGFVLLAAVGIWALIDGILILAGSPRDGRGLLLRS